ncbi:3-dehydroquinate synthase II [Archaeoglobus veneficus]|uniref:3-dehydroquinate synthase n=1 Tax=Archaeoglobus veneficus (strain DSM 11195 / SNP6) TaxID=693661 RepID=F2KPV6_ARCVS|nr:3-dehydroquinate synthase II [Archaeoglobus veneficus]AEA46463.1 3-dehydroquinate synthase [Archaeoglobus veneficus SNP6]
MKEIWLLTEGDNWSEVKEQVKDAIEIGFTGVVVKDEFAEKAAKLGRIAVVGKSDGEGLIGKGKAYFLDITSAEAQQEAIELSEHADYLFLSFSDWRIIPLENLIAMRKRAKIIAEVSSVDDARVVLTTLEKGADGIAVKGNREELLGYFKAVMEDSGRLNLKPAKIVEIKPLGVGERVCIDTVTLMSVGEGMLVGNKAGFMFLVASESEESEYVASRPFRVNAGSVNAYIKVGDKTKYLAELKTGDEVEIVRYDGAARKSYVGRVKIERRPLMLVRAVANGEEGSVILQNAETIKLITSEGKHKSVAELKAGDEVLVWVGQKARHFGVGVEEFIIER